jgi:hypothetical protein
MRTGRLAFASLVAAASLLVALALPGPATAGPALWALSFSLHDSNGYELTVTGFGPTVGIAVRRPNHHTQTDYLVHGKVTKTSIQASFPGLGRVDVHYRPARPTPSGAVPCQTALRGIHGSFQGKIEFHGENGYTTVHAHRAKGVLIDLDLLPGCSGGIPQSGKSNEALIKALLGIGGPRAKTTHVLAEWKQPLGGVFFEATQVGRDHTEFFAIQQQTSGRLAVMHIARAHGSAKMLASDPKLSFASVSPPAPFSGTGDLRHEADGRKRWSGTLTASFPGAPHVPLTGPDFKTILARSWGPLPTVPAPLPKRFLGGLPEQLQLVR